MIKKYKNTLLATFFLFSGMAFTASAFSQTCETLFKNKDYEKAIPLCVKEESYFNAGYSYATIADCENMKKYYLLADDSSSLGNLGLVLAHGLSGCEKDIEEAKIYLTKSVENGNPGSGYTLGNIYDNQGNKDLARHFYLKAINSAYSTDDWGFTRASLSWRKLTALLEDDERKEFFLKHLNMPTYLSDWHEEKASRSAYKLMSFLDFSEKIDVFLSISGTPDYKCEIGKEIYSQNLKGLLSHLQTSGKKKQFIDSLCEGEREFFLGRSSEEGIFHKEDFREAYRLYLIAGLKGHTNAKSARDRIRDFLSPEQLSQASCLADYGIDPGMYDKWKCDW